MLSRAALQEHLTDVAYRASLHGSRIGYVDRQIEAVFAALEPAGWRLVPVETLERVVLELQEVNAGAEGLLYLLPQDCELLGWSQPVTEDSE